ncbi:MAG: hypothetical protein EP330_02535 [Deltaproteobacteria bacterium]|nr:MAG: hypothetical protein EP330_02535 [Deltaproteobacteria bacterium]
MRARVALLAGSLLFLVAATPSRTYKRALKAHTEELIVYEGFETALIMRATLLTRDFRDTYADERRTLTGTSDEEHADFVRRNREDATAYHEVVFSSDSPKPNHQFGTGEDGWMLRLEADGQPQSLVTVYELDKPTSVQRALFTHLNIWSELWVARFASTVENPRLVELHVGSGYGHGTLSWDLSSH